MLAASEGGAARALDGAHADADVYWLGGDGATGQLPDGVAAPAVVVDLEGAVVGRGHALGTEVGRAWVAAVRPGGTLTLAVGPDRSWAALFDALGASGRTWRIAEVTAHPPVLHVALQLDAPVHPDVADQTFRALADAAAALGGALTDVERQRTAAAEASSGQARMAATAEADYQAAVRDLDMTRLELDRTRRELRRAQASLDRFRRSPLGRMFAGYRSLRRRIGARRSG